MKEEAPRVKCFAEQTGHHWRRMKILVVDDETVVLESCKKILHSEGYDGTFLSSVDDALTALDRENFNLLLVDIKMPKRDGLCLMEILRQRHDPIPILVMSGYSTDETINEAKQMGADVFVAKPFTPEELLGAVRKATGKEAGE
jgi:CheY-like chemotaxis protein